MPGLLSSLAPLYAYIFYFRIMSLYSHELPSVPRVFSEAPSPSVSTRTLGPATHGIDEMESKWLSRVSPSPCPSQPHPAFQDSNMGLKWLFDFRNMSSRTKVHAKLHHPSFWLITFLSPHCILDLNMFLNHCNFLAFPSRGTWILKSTSASQNFT